MSFRRLSVANVALAIAAMALLTACPFTPDYPVNLVISTPTLDFGPSATQLEFSVAKILTSRPMQPFTATTTAPWIKLTPQTGVSSGPSDPVRVTVTIDRSQLQEGENTGQITIACPLVATKVVQVRAQLVYSLPHAAFSTVSTRVVTGDTVQFTDTSQVATDQTITKWSWDFGDGSTSDAQNPTHSYSAAGNYTVSLSIDTGGGHSTAVKQNYISVFDKTALDTFVRTPDPNYNYSIEDLQQGGGFTWWTIKMTSQQWRTSAEVDHPIWRHWMTIIEPPKVTSKAALLFISGGSDTAGPPDITTVEAMLLLSYDLNAVVGLVEQVPNEPLTFSDETRSRSEDAIIAYSFDKYLTTGDPTWPALFPMVKSAVAAMNTVQSVVSSADPSVAPSVAHFVLSGASKRGWTTWLASETDGRVVGIVPMVIDVLNMAAQMDHQYRAYGRYSEAVQDYVDMNIFGRFDTPRGQTLLSMVDPYAYRDRATFPKLLLNSTGDQFFLPDSAQFYFNDLPGLKYLRYVPNTDHSLGGDYTDVLGPTEPFFAAALNGTPTPQFSWTVRSDGAIVVSVQTKPTSVKLWQATNTSARDFRLETIGPAWTSTDLQPDANGEYVGFPVSPQAWTAYMVELTFPSDMGIPFVFTTECRVTPDVLPYNSPTPTSR